MADRSPETQRRRLFDADKRLQRLIRDVRISPQFESMAAAKEIQESAFQDYLEKARAFYGAHSAEYARAQRALDCLTEDEVSWQT